MMGAEGPWPLPKGWRWVKLGEVASRETIIVNPGSSPNRVFSYLGMEHVSPGQWEEPVPVQVKGKELKSQVVAFWPGLVLYGKLRPYLNKVVVPTIKGIASTEFIPIMPDRRLLNPAYLGAYLRSPYFVAYATRNTTGSRQPRMRGEDLLSCLIPLPPLEEQRRIVARLEEVLGKAREARRLRAEARQEAERLLPSALAEVFPRPGAPLPKGWRWAELSDTCEIIMGQSPPSRFYNREGHGLPFFQGKADFGERHPVPRVWCTKPAKIAQPGDVLVSVRAPVGPVNIANTNCCIGRGLAALRPSCIDTEFLFYFLMRIENSLSQRGKGSAFQAITRTDLAKLPVPYAPYADQRRIVAYLDEVAEKARALKALQEEGEEELRRLEQSILERAFRGEL